MVYKNLKSKSVEELQKMIADLKAELFTLRFKNATGQLDQSHKIKDVRRSVAQCLTALKEKELESKKGAK
ncbi:50S ribosomal protein L29 [Mycoplasma sp. Mirounga ES2805-ORL]|uniref:50S ribosomal protein L29 n=1 Tax=Mycoplasma sp. Mirounga ES2805-ORL TaxID=754514 RepID=UPI00197C39B0|nr:50S ribosomal protein L29 [Mycoplasma sp. Mirounga ES2805-ORL]QSF13956.1 50S ribosomal protein L29 [Mycoplasma sp. Mirounga ES2805-ORL]